MDATKISVWYDATSGDDRWIVSADTDYGTTTLSTHDDRQSAIDAGRDDATTYELPLVEVDAMGVEIDRLA
ncbi:MAG: hypothetical protein ACKV2Q_36580 [Planctomycetaceae bacterium]